MGYVTDAMKQSDLLREIDLVIDRVGTTADCAIPLLQEIQTRFRYLPPEALQHIIERTDITPGQLTGVATFYSQFRHPGLGKHLIQVCHGTACHVAGAGQVTDSLRRHLNLSDPEQDTSADGLFTIERVACLGCCTLAPVMLVDGIPYGHLNPSSAPQALARFLQEEGEGKHDAARRQALAMGEPKKENCACAEVRVGLNSCCIANGSLEVRDAIEQEIARTGARAVIKPVGCIGMCHRVPIVEVVTPDGRSQLFGDNDPRQAARIIAKQLKATGLWRRARQRLAQTIELLIGADGPQTKLDQNKIDPNAGAGKEFLASQVRIATEFCGELDPLDLDEYIARGGYEGLRRAVSELTADGLIETVADSGLRGRGGAGFPAAQKWRTAQAAPGARKFVICNGDEGDPGAFMDRMMLEAYPHRIIEGLAIAARAVGAEEGYFYIRAEYALAVQRIQAAIAQAESRGLLGERIFGTDFSLRLRVMKGAGAFVCGEETALIASIEGLRGMPRFRPPYPAEQGLWDCPTTVNNVETLACLPWILRNGAAAFARLGTPKSRGTKVFALAGKVARGGLIEVPMGMTLWEIVQRIGGGVKGGGRLKAVQLGGPSGGCIPARLADCTIDFEAVTATGAIMGSGGLVVMDEGTCMVDMARFFLDFTQKESCGKCTFCRLGTKRMLEILERLCAGQGKEKDIVELEDLAQQVKQGSLCGLGKTAPNPILTTLKYFRDEYLAHVEGRCPAGHCPELISYSVTARCIGCTICAQECPTKAIPPAPYQRHHVEDEKCVRCGLCLTACPEKAIEIVAKKK